MAVAASVSVDEWKDGLASEPQAVLQAQCPGNCGVQDRHGQCGADGRCVCQDQWGGQDCSIPVGTLVSGQNVVDSVEGGAWRYFVTDTQPGQVLTWTVNSTGDCDLYVRHDSIPTRRDYDQNDIGLSTSFTLQAVNNRSRRWYTGVHGFMQCDYTIRVTVTGGSSGGECPKGCSGHGTCARGQCQCQEYWGGLDCSTPVTRLNLNQPAANTVAQMAWQYYFFFVNDLHALTVQLNETRSGGDADLFIKFGALPNHTSFDYRDISTASSARLAVQPASASTTMYVGIYGFVSTSYKLLVTQESSCPSQCSRHGQCSGTTCRCSYQFSGRLCETMNQPLADNQAIDGYVADGVWNYYHFSSSSLSAITIEVDQEDGDSAADCDIYVRAGSVPTQTTYDFADVSYSPQMTIAIPEPQFNTWYIGIYGNRKCAYQVRQYMSTSCVAGCTPPYGACTTEHTCYCYPGWAGDNCRIPVVPLGVGQTVEGSLGPNQITYYVFNASSSLASIGLLEVEPWARGYYWLFVGTEVVPDQENYDYSDKETNTPYHQIDIPIGASANETVALYIGVYGSPFDLAGPNHPPAHFKLTAWQTPF